MTVEDSHPLNLTQSQSCHKIENSFWVRAVEQHVNKLFCLLLLIRQIKETKFTAIT